MAANLTTGFEDPKGVAARLPLSREAETPGVLLSDESGSEKDGRGQGPVCLELKMKHLPCELAHAMWSTQDLAENRFIALLGGPTSTAPCFSSLTGSIPCRTRSSSPITPLAAVYRLDIRSFWRVTRRAGQIGTSLCRACRGGGRVSALIKATTDVATYTPGLAATALTSLLVGFRGAIVVAIAIGAAQYCVLTEPGLVLPGLADGRGALDHLRVRRVRRAGRRRRAGTQRTPSAPKTGPRSSSWVLRWTTP